MFDAGSILAKILIFESNLILRIAFIWPPRGWDPSPVRNRSIIHRQHTDQCYGCLESGKILEDGLLIYRILYQWR
jgi:hypothetical protein